MNSSFVFGRRSRTPKPPAAVAPTGSEEVKEVVSAETATAPMEVETPEFEAAGVAGVVGAAQEAEEMPLLRPPVKSRLGAVIAARSLALSDAAAVAMRRLPAWQRLGKK